MSQPRGIGLTAVGVARMRAVESARQDRMFNDPYAELFVAAVGEQLQSTMEKLGSRSSGFWTSMPTYLAVRTRFFDEYFSAADARQVVLLAAGLDARAYRIEWPAETTVFELDLPEMLEFKEDVLSEHGAQPSAKRVPLAADLHADWPDLLLRNGFDPSMPTAWLTEGLLMYFTQAQNDQLIERISGLSAPGSTLAFGHLSAESLAARIAYTADAGAAGVVKAMWQSGLDVEPDTWLARWGWHAEVHTPPGLAAAWGRPIEASTQHGETWLVSARR